VVARTFNATTWKAGLTWDINDALTVRWTRSSDFRAPSLYDLYQPIARGNTTNAIDYLLAPNGVASSPRQNTGGNPLLDPEVAHTTTLGIVYRPTPDFSLSLDAYRIKVQDALYQLSGVSEPVQRACYASGGTASVCQLQERANNSFTDTSASNVMTNFYNRSVNIAQQETSGIDLESNFRTDLFDRALSLRALVTYQPHILYYIPFASRQDVAGVAYPQVGGLPAPVWKASLFLNYKVTDRLGVDLSERFRSKLHFSSDPKTSNEVGGVASVAYTNLNLAYAIDTESKGGFEVFLNVQNLFNQSPRIAIGPGSTAGQNAANVDGDDFVGRYYTTGVRYKF
jgi:outer membrane receptor protein involved in Fe transport